MMIQRNVSGTTPFGMPSRAAVTRSFGAFARTAG
jgi:hypothetical protein